jgi:hypothetical protein
MVDLNYLWTSDKFIQPIVAFYPLDNAIHASYNAIFTLDKMYPLDSDLSMPRIAIYPPFAQPAPCRRSGINDKNKGANFSCLARKKLWVVAYMHF